MIPGLGCASQSRWAAGYSCLLAISNVLACLLFTAFGSGWIGSWQLHPSLAVHAPFLFCLWHRT